MNKHHTCLISALVILLAQTPATADMERGKALTGKHCIGCHDDGVYTRKERRVTTLDALGKQVRRCETNLGLTWFDEEINDVINYLNTQYYKFETTQ